ncbi:MAG: hypothetical protein JWR63_743, partial [Conexibacter sp.]|nr:hypothetical protein [Conexibacter sp.]
MNDQPVFEAQYVEQRSRLTTFFRLVLVIPHLVVLVVWGFLAYFAVFFAWVALVVTGRYPESLYSFLGGLLRYSTAVAGYYGLLTDEYPPFGPDTDGYPVHLKLPPPLPEYNRLHAAFRFITMIPPLIIIYALHIVWEIGVFLAWFAVLILGKQPKGLQDMIVLGLSYQQRAYAYVLLMTEKWPAFIDPQTETLEGPSGGSGLPPAPATPAP